MKYIFCLALVGFSMLPMAWASFEEKPLPFDCKSILNQGHDPAQWSQVYLIDYGLFNQGDFGQGSTVEFQVGEHLDGIRSGILPDLLQGWDISQDVLLTLSPDPQSKTLVKALEERLQGLSRKELDSTADPMSEKLGDSFYLPIWVKTSEIEKVTDRFRQTNHYRIFSSDAEMIGWIDRIALKLSRGPQGE